MYTPIYTYKFVNVQKILKEKDFSSDGEKKDFTLYSFSFVAVFPFCFYKLKNKNLA